MKFLKNIFGKHLVFWLFIAVIGIISFVIWNKVYNFNQLNNESIVAVSPSGKYKLQLLDTNPIEEGSSDNRLQIVSVMGKTIIENIELDSFLKNFIEENNVVWNNDETVFVLTHVKTSDNPSDTTAHMVITNTDQGIVINTVDLGKGAFYGINIDRAFPPVASPNGKYIAVQRELIHKISIYDFEGNLIIDLPTKYSQVPLFSDQMYELEEGGYSPWLDYKWGIESDTIQYRFTGTNKYYEIEL